VRSSDRAKAKGLAGATVTVKVKTAGFRQLTRQVRLEAPSNRADTLYRAGEALLRGLLDEAPFRLIGIGISSLTPAARGESGDAVLFEDDSVRQLRAESVTDEIRERFGKDAIIRGRALR